MYTVKKVSRFPVPSRDVTNQSVPGREKLNYFRPGRFWSVTSRLETGKQRIFFYSVRAIKTVTLRRLGLSIISRNICTEINIKTSELFFFCSKIYTRRN